ncbi:MAG: ParB N-terminal domain-containing protein [Lentisphaerae bacterium]|jgi:ParB family transcriptional regulator, chromosome partitioning protein|nr:ParB N-terminal domain-containing protein [Lentisphaerota bacterium]MBT5608614.1 ParB N-terminal domain-containing protein [Lentisphaerota bacterium]
MNARVVPMQERQYRMIRLDEIRVLNSRNRDEAQFAENVRSIEALGLLKPIVVNGRHYPDTGLYDLVCGEGRFLAHKRLGKPEIPAEVIDCDDRTALLYGMVENVARVPPGTMWFAHELKRMHDNGMTFLQISEIVGKSNSWVSDCIHLAAQGEERLIKGVEQGLFPISFAVKVARASDAEIQHVLMDAFDSGMIDTSNVTRVRTLIELRVNRGREPGRRQGRYTITQLKKDLGHVRKEKEGFVREATAKERRMLILVSGMNTLWQDEEFVKLLTEEGIGERPVMQGQYGQQRG